MRTEFERKLSHIVTYITWKQTDLHINIFYKSENISMDVAKHHREHSKDTQEVKSNHKHIFISKYLYVFC